MVTQSTYTKWPVYEDDLDMILGIIHVKDLLLTPEKGEHNNCVVHPDNRNAVGEPLIRAPRQQPDFAIRHEYGGRAA